jgi:glucose/arabinose dehydrogenase
MGHRSVPVTGLLTFLVCAAAGELFAQNVPGGFSAPEQQGTDLSDGTSMAFTPDGRLFVTRSTGEVRVFKNGALLPAAFMRLAINSVDERGLLGIAIDPDFAANGFVYVFYTMTSGTMNRVSRFVAAGDIRDVGVAEHVLLEIDTSALNPSYHNGGGLQFGADGKLLISVGDGMTAALSQNPASIHGKILRVNSDGSIPDDNPTSFQGIATTLPASSAVWAIGLRNPFAFAVQPGTGRVFINDVGEDDWEEINDGIRGRNYGWAGGVTDGRRYNPSYTDSIFEYSHADGPAPVGNVITGSAFYNPKVPQFPPSYVGKYFFSDAGVGSFIYCLDPATGIATAFLTGGNSPLDVDIGPDGALYYLARGGAHPGVYRIAYTGIVLQEMNVSTSAISVNEGSTATFTVRLAVNPGATPVVVNIGRSIGDASVTSSPATRTFTSADWNIGQSVTVTAAEDADLSDDGATITLTSAGMATQSVVVTALDNDVAASVPSVEIALPLNGQTVSGGSAEFYGHATDDSGSTMQAQFFIDGVLSYTDPNVVGHYHFGGGHADWDTRGLSNGPHVLQMRVSDGVNVGIHEITVVVSNPPSGGEGRGGGGGGCGLTGGETLVLVAVLGIRRRRRGRAARN